MEISKEDKRGFLAGLMDWIGEYPPTPETIAGIIEVELLNLK